MLNKNYILLACLITGILLSAWWSSSVAQIKISNNQELQKSVLKGWNTWNNSNVLSRVLMPEGLAVNLVFRKKRGGPYYLRESYIANQQRNFPEKITPLDHAYDGSYIEMLVEWVGLKAKIQSATDGTDLILLYTPLEVPDNPHILILESGIMWNKPGTLQKEGHTIRAKFPDREIVIHSTQSPAAYQLPFVTPFLTFDSDKQIGFYTGQTRSITDIQQVLNRQKASHQRTKEKYGHLSEAYHAIQTLLGWCTIYDAENDRAITPVSRVWNDAWGGYIIFDWDTYFTAYMLALDHKELAYSNAIAITHAITEAGFIPNLEASFSVKTFDRSQPPVGSLMCKMIYDRHPEKWFLEEVYPKLLRWNRWWEKARDNRGYLSWGTKPHPREIDPPNKQAAKFESGLDNSPLFDEAVFNEQTYLLELASVGLMGLYLADCQALIKIANILNKPADIKEISKRAEKYSKSLQKLWDEQSGIYRDFDLVTQQFTRHLAPTHFYPLLAKAPSQKQAERMINEHFFNPQEFYGDWILPSISRDDPGYQDNSYWRGRIWAPMNFLVYLGLRNYDLPRARQELAEKSLKLILKEWIENRRVYENYNAETGVGGDVRNANSFYSWGALLGMIALMEGDY